MRPLTQAAALISIITPSFDRVALIKQAIESVVEQAYSPVEHFIVDGGSTDGTLGLLSKYSHLKVVSGPDNGMYDALNKGLKLAHGEIIGFLNTDDLYAPGVFKEAARLFADPSVDAVAGTAEVFYTASDGKVVTLREIVPPSPGDMLEHMVLNTPGFNAWFFRRKLVEQIGSFDANYRLSGDREFMIRLALAGISYQRTDRVVYRYRRHAGALTFNWASPFFLENTQEHLKLIDHFISLPAVSERSRKYFQRLRTRDTANAVLSLLRRGALGKAWFFARAGLRSDWSWPLQLIARAFHRLTHPVPGKPSNKVTSL
jgi:glycosyltransferase involved in cell wall biosynthesis